MSMIDELKNQPSISFIENFTLEDIQTKLLNAYSEEYEKITGISGVLNDGDESKLILNSAALILYQLFLFLDNAGKMNLLGYACGEYLDGIAATRGLLRKSAAYAQALFKFELSAPRSEATPIPGGTRIADSYGHYFATREYAEIKSGDTYAEVFADAVEPGEASNNLPVGAVNIIVDTLPYIFSVSNISVSVGGSDTESDTELTKRIFLYPGSFSSAGSAAAYEYFAKNYRTDIGDVHAFKSNDMEVTVLFTLADGALPTQSDITDMVNYLSESDKRPLTDLLVVSVPAEVNYSIKLTYYINKYDSNNVSEIQKKVTSAVAEYKAWQRHIGRDINPSELIHRIISAGAKRVEILSPVYTEITDIQISKLSEESVTYGGIEND